MLSTRCRPIASRELCFDSLLTTLSRPDGVGMSLHELGLGEALKMTKQLGCAPEDVVVFGIKPSVISSGLELSDEIAASIPRIVELVLEEIAK